MWNIKAPPKVLNNLWRVISSCPPTMTQLHYKHVLVHTICPVCSVGEETTMHALALCSFTSQCWRIIMPDFTHGGVIKFAEWFLQVIDRSTIKK